MAILIIAEHNNQTLKAVTLNAVSAAQKIAGQVDLLVAGNDCRAVADEATRIEGIHRVLLADDPAYQHQLAENLSLLVTKLVTDNGDVYSHILAPATTSGKNFMPRVAALLDVNQISDIIQVIDHQTYQRPIYAGNAIATVKSSDPRQVITVRSTGFEPADHIGDDQQPVAVTEITGGEDAALSKHLSDQLAESHRPELTSARVVISGGRGMGDGDSFKLLDAVADKLGAAVGASRAAVDAGFAPNDMQVGQTGKIVAPELYLAVGISGAIQHLAGMKDSKIIVAINKDEEAPIFQVADYGLVADLFDAMPALEAQI